MSLGVYLISQFIPSLRLLRSLSAPAITILVREPLTLDLTGLPLGPLNVMFLPSGDTVRRALFTLNTMIGAGPVNLLPRAAHLSRLGSFPSPGS